MFAHADTTMSRIPLHFNAIRQPNRSSGFDLFAGANDTFASCPVLNRLRCLSSVHPWSLPAQTINAMSPARWRIVRRRKNVRAMPPDRHDIEVSINGMAYRRAVDARLLLSDFLRHELQLAGTHVGCEHGVCGACTILFDGMPVRSCLMLAVQAHGRELLTVEGLATASGELNPLQQAMHEHHGLQCGYCTPGILMTMTAFLKENAAPSEDEVRKALSGHLCRCTGYQNIVDAILEAAATLRASTP
jgi:aerobic-type carbon monoxide dehydrogenase small subunit (CoxS/CutS family)